MNRNVIGTRQFLLFIFLFLLLLGIVGGVSLWYYQHCGKAPKAINKDMEQTYMLFGKENYRVCKGCEQIIIDYYTNNNIANEEQEYNNLKHRKWKNLIPPIKVRWCYKQTGLYEMESYLERAFLYSEDKGTFKNPKAVDVFVCKLWFLYYYVAPNPSYGFIEAMEQYRTKDSHVEFINP